MGDAERVRAIVDEVYRTDSRRVLATLIRVLGDFDSAEEALHDAFVAALEQWPQRGVPENPVSWLVSAGRFRAIDRLRKVAAQQRHRSDLVQLHDEWQESRDVDQEIADDRLRLVFTCCHPALALEAQVALTLRSVCGLTTEEIARAFLTTPSTMAQRIVRAKAKIRDARIPYEIPDVPQLPERLDSVLQVIYLIFNEGYSATSGASVSRADLATEAIRLGRLLLQLMDDREVRGLLGLMLLQESRRASRESMAGEIILLADQDRSRWDRALIAEGAALVEAALGRGEAGPFGVQGAIAALHATAPTSESTDWAQIAALYDLLMRIAGTPVVELNRAVAQAMLYGPAHGLQLVDAILARGELQTYVYAHASRGEFLTRLGRAVEARVAYEVALGLVQQEPERRLLEARIAALGTS